MESRVDESVNFVHLRDGGEVEARFVRRADDYFICYLSSHTGCNKGCRFCHLTQTAQTSMVELGVDELFDQADTVLGHYDRQPVRASEVHFNFMARGEAFASSVIRERGDEVVAGLSRRAADRGLFPSVKFSTIFPTELAGVAFTDMFKTTQPDVYYSLYSLRPEFRRRWLPRAADPNTALAALRAWQVASRKIPVLHWAFIEGENDSFDDIADVVAAVRAARLRCDVNIVRYNPYSEKQGAEPPEAHIEALADRLRDGLPDARVKVVTRVGFDVAASCGMFVGGRRPSTPSPVTLTASNGSV